MKLRHTHLLILDFRLGIGNVGVGLGIFYDGVQLEAQVPKSFLEPRRKSIRKLWKVFRRRGIVSDSQRLF